MTPLEFCTKWRAVKTNERQASQEQFLDICRMLGEKSPQAADPKGTFFCFEKGAEKTTGSNGWADVWRKGCFAWEYKGPHKDLKAAYEQLLQYRESLENPPLLVVSNIQEFEVHTNFTNTAKRVYHFSVQDFCDAPEEPLRILRALFKAPELLRPNISREQLTEETARTFAELAGRLQQRGHEPMAVAHFLTRLLFCFFAEDANVLPPNLLKRLLESVRDTPADASPRLTQLFRLMSKPGPERYFGTERIEWFNGGLFNDDQALPLTVDDVTLLLQVAEKDWSNIEPAILGTLFERGLDPAKRSQLGAHYTAVEDIERIIEPVVLRPLRRELAQLKEKLLALNVPGKTGAARTRAQTAGKKLHQEYLKRLRAVRVLDPSSGSGNFLYVALKQLKALEKEAILLGAEALNVPLELPQVGPEAVHGIELNPYAAELARVTVWIGELQWMISNGFSYATNPILKPLDTIECRDAILDRSTPGTPKPAAWPATDFIVGNPPFLGGKKMRTELGDDYVKALFKAWRGRVGAESDLVVYWHEMARELIEEGRAKRAGLISTQGIRGGKNQEVLQRIKESGDIFLAYSDEPWVVEGADVRISIVCQDDGSETERTLDGKRVDVIHADLKGGAAGKADVTLARRLEENRGVGFMGDSKGGPFNIPGELAAEMLRAPTNVNGRSNADVVLPWANGFDVTRRPRGMFLIDFGVDMDEAQASKYEAPFEYVRKHVRPKRLKNKREVYAKRWWLHVEPRRGLRTATAPLSRMLVTVRHMRHRLFTWLPKPTIPDSALIAFARDDDYFFGVLSSRIHQVWSLHKCTFVGVGNDPRYTPTSTFETFPFPWPLNTQEADLNKQQRTQRDAIAAAAKRLDLERSRWLNPAGLATQGAPLAPSFPAPWLPVSAEAAKSLKDRTLTNLYNESPAWLENAHSDLDAAVFAAYGWQPSMTDEAVLEALLDLNLSRPAAAAGAPEEDDDEEGDED